MQRVVHAVVVLWQTVKSSRKLKGLVCWGCSGRYRDSMDEKEATTKEGKTVATGQDVNREVTKLFESMSIDTHAITPDGEHVAKLFESMSLDPYPTNQKGEDVTALFQELSIGIYPTNPGVVDQPLGMSY